MRRSASVEATVPWLYLHGVSTGKMRQAVAALVGEEAARAAGCTRPATSSTTSRSPGASLARCVGEGEAGPARDLDGRDARRGRRAFDNWIERYEEKYPKATACLARDREELLAFYNFPAAHWTHLRTTNVIESAFATIRHRSSRAKGCVTRQAMLSMIYKMGMSAEQSWRRLRGFRQPRTGPDSARAFIARVVVT